MLSTNEAEQEAAEDCGYHSVENRILVEQISKIAGMLPDRTQADVICRLAKGKTVRQVAHTLQMPLSSVYRARRKAAVILKQWMDEKLKLE